MRQKLLNISPLDGRYASKLSFFKDFFSESALFKKRIFVEIEYLKQLSSFGVIRKLSQKEIVVLDQIVSNFDLNDALRIKEIEEKINHDIKAVEYFLREKFNRKKLEDLTAFIHLGLTSEDINNLAYGLIFKDFKKNVLEKELEKVLVSLKELADRYKKMPFLARSHGQPAVPTTFGKEIANFVHRLQKQQKRLNVFKFEGKLNGAVGNYNALSLIFRQIDWIKFSRVFIGQLGLVPNFNTTQILPYDNWVEFFQKLILINNIFLGLSRDIWTYIMLEELRLIAGKNQVGSSTMPQKVNPIDFENAEGNLEVANSYFQLYERKLPISRLQRDLSDSTVRRTFGVALGHTVLAWNSLQQGLGKIALDEEKIKENLNHHWEVLAEAIQVYLRSTGEVRGYEKIKKITQGKKMTRENYLSLIKELRLDKTEIDFINLSPEKYVGLADKLIGL